MESLVWLAIPGMIIAWLFLPRKAREKSNSGAKKYRTSGAVLFGINDVVDKIASNNARLKFTNLNVTNLLSPFAPPLLAVKSMDCADSFSIVNKPAAFS